MYFSSCNTIVVLHTCWFSQLVLRDIRERTVDVFTLPAYCGMFSPKVKLKIEQPFLSASFPFHSHGKDNFRGICTVYIIQTLRVRPLCFLQTNKHTCYCNQKFQPSSNTHIVLMNFRYFSCSLYNFLSDATSLF